MRIVVAKCEGPFFTRGQAAEFCGYAQSYFSKLLRKYDIPKFGPKGNRFDRATLLKFMENPDGFRRRETAKTARIPKRVEV